MERIRLRSRSTGRAPGVAADDRQVFRYQVDFGAGEQDVVSLLEPDWVFKHGLHPEAILGVLRDGADPDELEPVDVQENGAFLRLLSRVIFENVADCDDIRWEAEIQGTGYVYLLDARTPDPAGRVPAEDIVGAVQGVNLSTWRTPGRLCRTPLYKLHARSASVYLTCHYSWTRATAVSGLQLATAYC